MLDTQNQSPKCTAPVILVVEEGQSIQGVVEDALTEGGFEPATAPSGEEAVTLLKGGLTKYRALVTDISLRGRIDGWEVAQRAREIDPEFPIVYLSGTSVADWPSKGVPNSIMLAKPFAPAQLVTAVSQLLNAGSRRPRQRSKPPQLAASFHFGLKVSLLPQCRAFLPACQDSTYVALNALRANTYTKH